VTPDYHEGLNNKMQIHTMYNYLFKNDLNSVKQRTMIQLETLRNQQGNNQRDIDVLMQEKVMLLKTLKRYKEMIEDINQ